MEKQELLDFLDRHHIEHGEEIPYQGGGKYILKECPFDSSHTGTDAFVGMTKKGIPYFKCSHNSCINKKWTQFVTHFEPDYHSKLIKTTTEKNNSTKLQELPPIVRWSDVYENIPPRAPELIHGILRQGHKMLLTGASKAGKSFLLIELAIAIAEGKRWLNFQCSQGAVLYINLEIEHPSFLNRVEDIYNALGWTPQHREDLYILPLRGMAAPLDQLAPLIIERMKGGNFAAVILDPIYKVITGDENNASDMGAFCNQFDKICHEVGCAAIYCHHHSKGGQGNKRAIDRGSGSGVFGRDPDAILDMIELEVTPEERFGHPKEASAWRLEASLREFKQIAPVNFWYEYPLHILDESGELEKLNPRGSSLANLDKSGKKNSRKENAERVRNALEYLIGADGQNHTTIKAVMEYLGEESPSDTAIRNYIKELLDDEFEYKNKLIFNKPLQVVECDCPTFGDTGADAQPDNQPDTQNETQKQTKTETKKKTVSSSAKKSNSKKRTK